MALESKHVGKAGEMVVKAELLTRDWIVGSPMIDVGEDVFAFEHDGGELSRLQVKTAGAEHTEYGYAAQLGDGGVEKVLCEDSDLTEYADDFSRWPPIEH